MIEDSDWDPEATILRKADLQQEDIAEGTVIWQHLASQQPAAELEQNYTKALNHLDCVFQDGLRALDHQSRRADGTSH